MAHPIEPDVTALLKEWSGGDRKAFGRLMPLVYKELRRPAVSSLRDERPDHIQREIPLGAG